MKPALGQFGNVARIAGTGTLYDYGIDFRAGLGN
jgi:hypothetical protein